MKKITLLIAAFYMLMSGPAFSAPGDKVRISEVNDINLGNWALSSMSGNDPVCVYRNNSIPTYKVTATDNSTITPGNFYLQNAAATAQIRYSLNWGATPAPGAIPLADGVQLSTTGANLLQSSCNGGDSANFKVDINNSDLAAVPAGTYTATVTLLTVP